MEKKIKKLYKKIAIVNILLFVYFAVSLAVSIFTKSDTWISIGYSVFCLISFIGVIKNSITQAQQGLDDLKLQAKEDKKEEEDDI